MEIVRLATEPHNVEDMVPIIRETVEGIANWADTHAVVAAIANDPMVLPMHPEIEWDASRLDEMIPDLAEVYWGHEGVRTYWRRWFEAWSDLEFEIQDVRDAGDHVLVLIRNQRQWGRHTGISTGLRGRTTSGAASVGASVRALVSMPSQATPTARPGPRCCGPGASPGAPEAR